VAERGEGGAGGPDPLEDLIGSPRPARRTPTERSDALDDLIGAARAARRNPADLDDLLAGTVAAGRARRAAGDEAAADAPTAASGGRSRWIAGLAVTLALVGLSGVLTDAVAAAVLLADHGPGALAVVWPLGGLGLLAVAALQSRYVDRFARVPVLVTLCGAYAALFVVALVLLAAGVERTIPATLTWLLADQMNFLLPVVVWALAGDVFTAGQGTTVFPVLSRWLYAGQVAGLAVATVAPLALRDAAMAWLLAVPAVLLVLTLVVAPVLLRGAATGRGHGRAETTADSMRSTLALVRDLPAFRWLLRSSLVVMAAGYALEFAFFAQGRARLSALGELQAFYAGATLVGFGLCWAVQSFVTPRLLKRVGVARVLGILPAATLAAAVVLTVAGASGALALSAVGLLIWRLPRWSVDASARQAAQAIIPDERRARTSLLVDLVPVAGALVVAAVPISVSVWLDRTWPAPVLAAVLAVPAILASRRVVGTWEDTQLSYRLKRRRRLG